MVTPSRPQKAAVEGTLPAALLLRLGADCQSTVIKEYYTATPGGERLGQGKKGRKQGSK